MDAAEVLGPVYAGKRVLLAGGPIQSKTGAVAALQALGAVEVPRRHQVGEETHTDGDLSLVLGPSPTGAFLGVTTTDTPADGEPFAPTAARAIAVADHRWDLGLGPLAPAPALR